MKAFIYNTSLQWKMDLRNRNILVVYYLVPLCFFLLVGKVFVSINPEAQNNLMQTMTVFAVTMGAVLGAPATLIDFYQERNKKAYRVGGIPLWAPTLSNLISAFIHLLLTSLIIYGASPLVFATDLPPSLGWHLFKLALFLLTSLLVGSLLALFTRDPLRLPLVGQLVFLPSILLSGIMFPADLLPQPLLLAGKIFPATWAYELLVASSFSPNQALPLLGMSILGGLLAYWQLKKLSRPE